MPKPLRLIKFLLFCRTWKVFGLRAVIGKAPPAALSGSFTDRRTTARHLIKQSSHLQRLLSTDRPFQQNGVKVEGYSRLILCKYQSSALKFFSRFHVTFTMTLVHTQTRLALLYLQNTTFFDTYTLLPLLTGLGLVHHCFLSLI